MSVLDRVCFVGLYSYKRRLFGYDKVITEEKRYDGLRLKQMYKSYPENYTDSHYFFIPSPVSYSSTMDVEVCGWRRKREFFIKSFIFDLGNMRIRT